MVHALREAHRVLKPNGILFDMRPGVKHRRVGLWQTGHWRTVGTMRETFEDDRAADAAVAQVLRQGLFRAEGQTRLELARYMDTLADFRGWLEEYYRFSNLASHDWLVQRIDNKLSNESDGAKIVVRGPLDIRMLRKLG